MKTRYMAVSVLLLLASAAIAHADTTPVDPRMAITDPVCEDCQVGLVFSFFADAAGGGLNTFENNSGQDWTSLLITSQTNILAANVTATSTQFENVSVSNVGNLLEILYSGVTPPNCELNCFNGILSGSDQNGFSIELNDVSGIDGGGWAPGQEFDATANAPVPEPATLTLMGVGIAALVAKRKLRSQRKTQQADIT